MRRILLVDDSATFARLVNKILSQHFQVVGHGKDGADGFALYKTLKPDLVLLDITMPNVNGKDCLAGIIKENPNAKVIMVSSLGDEQTVTECMKLGAKAFVNKDTVRMGSLDVNPSLRQALQSVLGEALLEAV